jgi:hypothetical protein
MIRVSDEDSPLYTTDHKGERRTVIIKKRTPVGRDPCQMEINIYHDQVIVDVIGLGKCATLCLA